MTGGVFVKFCGITRVDDALAAARLGVDALGFNFWPASPRAVEPARAREIGAGLPPHVRRVGVFVDEPPARILDVVHAAGLDAVQLHGDEPPEWCAALAGIEVIKALQIGPGFDAARLRDYPCRTFLLDGYAPGAPGGTGTPFDWKRARGWTRDHRVILAGGLSPSNVADAIEIAAPWGVDVASGIESAPGEKDGALMTGFVAAVRDAGGGRRSEAP